MNANTHTGSARARFRAWFARLNMWRAACTSSPRGERNPKLYVGQMTGTITTRSSPSGKNVMLDRPTPNAADATIMKPRVGVIMGSQSDWGTMQHAVAVLEKLGIPYERKVVSAHRTPDLLFDYAETAEERGLEVIIARGGGAAHLPGMRGEDDPPGARRADRIGGAPRVDLAVEHRADALGHPRSARWRSATPGAQNAAASWPRRSSR